MSYSGEQDLDAETQLALSAWLREQAERIEKYDGSLYAKEAAKQLRLTADSYEEMVETPHEVKTYSQEILMRDGVYGAVELKKIRDQKSARDFAEKLIEHGAVHFEEIPSKPNPYGIEEKLYRARLHVLQPSDT